MESLPGTHRISCPSLGRVWITFSVLQLLGSAGYLDSFALGQQTITACRTSRTTPIRVENSTGITILRAEANCTDHGKLEVEWAGVALTISTPITIASGTFLSLVGDDSLAEVEGGSLTRLFQVSPGGSLSLTQLRLSGGAAGNGGAIKSDEATLTLSNCILTGNKATVGDGGAVWADGGSVTIVGGELLGNSAARNGGAVLATGGSVVVKGGARFESNLALAGGALHCSGVTGTAGSGLVTDDSGQAFSVTDAEFISNSAARASESDVESYAELDGGGAVAFLHANVAVTNSVFIGNHATLSGGALFGGNASDVTLQGCTFENNTSSRYGGAIMASSMTLEGGTLLANNVAASLGGAVFGWDTEGTIGFNDVVCEKNSAEKNGGCLYTVGASTATNGTVMHNNFAENGGCIYAFDESDISVDGGDYMCQCAERGGFIYVGDGTRLKITGGLFANNFANRRAGVIYCNGDAVSTISIEGGTFRDNIALELGGAIVAWGVGTVVNITGGEFSNNTAKFYGGFIFLEEEASLTCKGASITGNFAGDQGGGIYAREATAVHSSCDVIANESPQGAALYLTNVNSATFEDHKVADNLASGGSVVYVAASSVVARGVTFESGVGLQEDSSNRAVQLDGDTTLTAEGCVFDGWLGDTVIYHMNSANGSLVLDSCDFTGSSATMAVISPNSDAEIRNAVVGDRMFLSSVTGTKVNSSLTLVDRALVCSDPNVCGPGDCVDSALGVLCECLEGGECLNDGGGLSLDIKTHPDNVTYSPDTVSYELVVSSAASGTTNAIWNLDFDGGGDLTLSVVPSSGVLPPGSNVTVQVTGAPSMADVGGAMTSSFVLKSVGTAGFSDSDTATAGVVKLEVDSMFYLCYAYEYAKPRENGDGVDSGGGDVSCEQCATIDGEDGVDCDTPGATLASLPIREGYWRESQDSLVVYECLYSAACAGATEVSSSDDYCEDGYKGPYCAVCSEGYGRGAGNSCHHCDNTKARLLIAAGSIFSLVVLLLLLLATVFLVGGLDAIDIVRRQVSRKLPFGTNNFSKRWRFSSETDPMPGSGFPRLGAKIDSLDTTVAPVYDFALEENQPRRASGGSGVDSCDSGHHRRVFPLAYSEAGDGVHGSEEALDTRGEYAEWEAGVSGGGRARPSAVAGAGLDVDVSEGGASGFRGVEVDAGDRGGAAIVGGGEVEDSTGGSEGGKETCCGLGSTVKRITSRLPLDKLKILVVVWQILAVFSSITGVEFPATYARFLSWITVVNLDIGNIFSASCLLPSLNFYVSLLVTTLAPLALSMVLVLTYHWAKRRAGIGRAGVIARRAAWSRHVAAGLLLTFLVFTSTSTVVFKTFACDYDAVRGEGYLRADYSLSCTSTTHTFFEVYAYLMILVYPIGIPALYATILWQNRELLNPRIHSHAKPDPDDGPLEAEIGADPVSTTSKGQTKKGYSAEELQELEDKVEARKVHPDLVPSMFLWKDFGPELYYYEVIECGRRILLTGVLIFIVPHSPTQTAMACIFAFASILGFELLRPHLDPADAWLYRMGCVIIFLSNFLALLIKVDAAGEENRAAFGGLLVAINVLLVLAVLVASWFATQQSVDDHREEENSFTVAKTMLTAERYAADSTRHSRERGQHAANCSDRHTHERGRGAAAMAAMSSAGVRPYIPQSGSGVMLPMSPTLGPHLPTSDGAAIWGVAGAPPPTQRLQRSGTSGMTTSEDVAPSYERATGKGVAAACDTAPWGGTGAPPPTHRLRRSDTSGMTTSEDVVPTYDRAAGRGGAPLGGTAAWDGAGAPPATRRLQRSGTSGMTTSEDVVPTYDRAAGRGGAPLGGTAAWDGAGAPPATRRLQRSGTSGMTISEDVVPSYERATGRVGTAVGGTAARDEPPPTRTLRTGGLIGGASSKDIMPSYEHVAGRGEASDDTAAWDGSPLAHGLQRGGADGVTTSEDIVSTYERPAGWGGAALAAEEIPTRWTNATRGMSWQG